MSINRAYDATMMPMTHLFLGLCHATTTFTSQVHLLVERYTWMAHLQAGSRREPLLGVLGRAGQGHSVATSGGGAAQMARVVGTHS